MVYKFVNFSSNVSPVYSVMNCIWKDENTGIYYIDSNTQLENGKILQPYLTDIITKSYYKQQLSNYAKQITQADLNSGVVEYNKSKWKVTIP